MGKRCPRCKKEMIHWSEYDGNVTTYGCRHCQIIGHAKPKEKGMGYLSMDGIARFRALLGKLQHKNKSVVLTKTELWNEAKKAHMSNYDTLQKYIDFTLLGMPEKNVLQESSLSELLPNSMFVISKDTPVYIIRSEKEVLLSTTTMSKVYEKAWQMLNPDKLYPT